MKYTFNNLMKPYVFNNEGCCSGNKKIFNYGDFDNFQLKEISLIDNTDQVNSIKGIKKLFHKPLHSRLIVKYQLHDFMKMEEIDIQIDSDEMEDARKLVVFLDNLIKKYHNSLVQKNGNVNMKDVVDAESKTCSSAKILCSKVNIDAPMIEKIKKIFIAIDTETTGLSPVNDRIVEIGAVKFVDGIPQNTFSSLVNPGIKISPAASRVNHITNEMIESAKREEEAFSDFIKFLGDGASGGIILCAHNASFDFGFLENTFKRLNTSITIKYIDTLSFCKSKIVGLNNYKQSTLEDYFSIVNDESHRALSDAVACGKILLHTIDYKNDNKKSINETEIKNMSPEELEVCAVFYDILYEAELDASYLRFEKNTICTYGLCYNSFISFNFLKKGRYLIVPSDFRINDDSIEEQFPNKEGLRLKRIYFQSPLEIKKYSKYIIDIYKDSYFRVIKAKENSRKKYNTISRNREGYCRLNYADVKRIMEEISHKDYSYVNLPDSNKK